MPASENALKAEFGPVTRSVAKRYFSAVQFPDATEHELRGLHEKGFVVHVMRTTAWVNFLYLAWAMILRGLPPIRAVVNLRPWFSKPWRKTAQRGDFEVRFTYARRHGGSGLVFLHSSALGRARGKTSREDPFPALVALARKSDRPVYLVPELFVWEKWSGRMKPALMDYVFGSPDSPGFLHSVMAFWRNHHRALFRMGEPIDLCKYIADNPKDGDALIARKVRGSLHHHLARETRAVFGPPFKPAARVIEETLRDRSLRKVIEAEATAQNRRFESVEHDARRNLNQIAARQHPSVIGLLSPILNAVFNRIYDGIDVDEAALHRAMRAASNAPLVLCPSHKSHVDYLVLGWVLYSRGYTVPLVAAGANLSFFPLGFVLRRAGAFFLRRSFKGDKLYTASFKAYVKKLAHDGSNSEFFPEGGRSRTGKLLPAKLGLLTWEVEAVLEGARNDLNFVPVSIDYEKVVESSSYREELAGGEKKPEDLRGLLKTPKVLTSKYGRIHLGFDAPVSLVELMKSRGLTPDAGDLSDEQKKGLVRALGHRIMHGISRVSTVTPHALVSMSMLAHRGRGIAASELDTRIQTLRRMLEEDGAPSSKSLVNAPSDPTVLGPIHDAIRTFSSDGMVRTEKVKNEIIYQAENSRRLEMSFYKNTMMNLFAPRALVACALFADLERPAFEEVRQRALELSRLFKVEFIYRVDASFDAIFAETAEKLVRGGLIRLDGGVLRLAPEPHSRPALEFLADMLRDYLESYLLAAITLQELSAGPMEKKAFVKSALETGRAEFLTGRIQTPEALSRTTLENAVSYFLDQKIIVETDRKLGFGAAGDTRLARVEELKGLLRNLNAGR